MQHALLRVLKALVFRGDPASPLNELPISQLRCLHVVAEHEGEKMQEISHRLEIGLPAMSQIVNRLVKRGLVERQPDPSDRRVVRLVLSHEAKIIHAEACVARQARVAATALRLDPVSMNRVIDGLTMLAVAAEAVEADEREAITTPSQDSDPVLELLSHRTRRRSMMSAARVSPPMSPIVENPGQ